MSGYKRVNFYELCRLCASNQQKEKTHIFQEEGRKIQLQNKIQSCLSLKVCENDFLPKVVCSQCLRTLEECYTFRNECVSSETMLSSYFNNFRYTEDFKKSGKVYIKDTTTKTQQKELTQKQGQHFEFIAIPNGNNISNNTEDNGGAYVQSQNDKALKNDSKPFAYNLSTINFAALKGIVQNIPKNEQINNISVSSNGEIINITPLIDLESIFVQNQLQKPLVKQICKSNKKLRPEKHEPEADLKRPTHDRYDKLPHIKSTQPNKFAYAIKIEECSKNGGGGSAVVVNQLSNMNIPVNNNSHNNFNTNYNSVQNVNVTSNSIVNQTNNTATNWNFTTPSNNSLNIMNNSNLVGTNNQTMFNQSSNWNMVTTTTNITSNNLTQTNTNAVTTNIVEQSEKLIQSIQQLPQDNKQNILNGNRNSDIQTVDMSSIKNDPLKTFPCELCPKVFKRREHLYQHVKLHTGFRPFGCENCKKSFMRKEHLMRHLTSHTGQKNFTCNICEKSFSRNDNLLKHKKTHEKQTSFTCEICQKQFVMKHYYLAHRMGHESSEKCQFWNILKT